MGSIRQLVYNQKRQLGTPEKPHIENTDMELPSKIRRIYTTIIPRLARKKIERLLSGPYPRRFENEQFIFIHIPKTAGKSVNEILDLKGARHLKYLDYKREIGERISEYYIFSVIRHPEERLISAYYYLKNNGNQSREDTNFNKKWISTCSSIDDFVCNNLKEKEVLESPFFCPQTDYLSDSDNTFPNNLHIIRFENIDTEINQIPDRIKKGKTLPHLNANKVDKSQPALSVSSKKVIAETYSDDFVLLGYKEKV